MGVEYPEGGREGGMVKWTYQLEDGRCVDSMAWFTARKYGIPEAILERARVLGGEFDQACRGGGRVGGREGWRGECRTLEGAEEVLTDILQRFYSSSSSSSSSLPPSLPPFLRVPSGFDPSSSLEGNACLYILFLPSSPSSPLPPSFYVGETNSARQRLAQHRARFDGRREGGREKGLEAVVIPLSSKSEARVLEGLLINEMTQRGFPLWSDRDGRRKVGR